MGKRTLIMVRSMGKRTLIMVRSMGKSREPTWG
jgi:hypothetical protein